MGLPEMTQRLLGFHHGAILAEGAGGVGEQSLGGGWGQDGTPLAVDQK
jgi:hypothetical protein